MIVIPAALAVLAAGLAPVPQDAQQRIASIAARAADLVEHGQIGTSLGGRPIQLVTVAGPGDVPAAQRPGILIVAGADGTHRLGTDLAIWQLGRLVDAHAAGDADAQALLARCVLYFVPELNPDGPALGRIGNARVLDLDRDGREDEDGPQDLNGDGRISQMRWLDPEGEWMIDPDEPRLLRKADRQKGERGTHRLEAEGIDQDGDGERGEDDGQGVLLHRNFAHRYDEFDRRTGTFPMSEPETQALADFVFGHRNIAMAFAYDVDDNLLGVPEVGEPKPRVQLTGILEGDKALYERAGELYREATGRSGTSHARHDGSLWSWLYFQVGVPTFATDVWRVPEPAPDAEPKLSPERRRLAHCVLVGAGFSDWETVQHAQLGEVEVGGFVQGQDYLLLPREEREPLFEGHHRFFMTATTWLPHCHIASFEKKAQPGGAVELEAIVENDGGGPALIAIAEHCRRFSRPRLILSLGKAEMLAGDPRPRVDNLGPSGARQHFKWLVAGAAGTTIRLELFCDPAGVDAKEVTL